MPISLVHKWPFTAIKIGKERSSIIGLRGRYTLITRYRSKQSQVMLHMMCNIVSLILQNIVLSVLWLWLGPIYWELLLMLFSDLYKVFCDYVCTSCIIICLRYSGGRHGRGHKDEILHIRHPQAPDIREHRKKKKRRKRAFCRAGNPLYTLKSAETWLVPATAENW